MYCTEWTRRVLKMSNLFLQIPLGPAINSNVPCVHQCHNPSSLLKSTTHWDQYNLDSGPKSTLLWSICYCNEFIASHPSYKPLILLVRYKTDQLEPRYSDTEAGPEALSAGTGLGTRTNKICLVLYITSLELNLKSPVTPCCRCSLEAGAAWLSLTEFYYSAPGTESQALLLPQAEASSSMLQSELGNQDLHH